MSNLLEQIEEIQKNIREIKGTWGNTIMTLDNIKSGLKSDVQKRVDEAYQKGYKDCETRYCSFDSCPNRQAEYQRGLDDGKAVYDKGCKGCEYESRTSDQNPCCRCARDADDYWTAKDDKIEVGDEVKPFYSDIAGVVTLVDGDTIYVLWRDGSSTSTLKLKEVRKTGRHFDIASILEDMRNG